MTDGGVPPERQDDQENYRQILKQQNGEGGVALLVCS